MLHGCWLFVGGVPFSNCSLASGRSLFQVANPPILIMAPSPLPLCSCLLNGHGAIGCIMMFFMGEVTSPIFNAFSISK